MGEVQEIKISSLDEFNTCVADLYSKGFSFFRGDKETASNRESLLLTSFDKKKDGEFLFDSKDCDNMINDFISISLSKMNYVPTNYFEKMLTAQHYGIPTRLQDWSESPLIALFFSTSNSRDLNDDDNCIIWCLNPIELNSKTKQLVSDSTGESFLPNISLEAETESALGYINKYYGVDARETGDLFPIAVSTYKINPRIEAQKGVFLIYPRSRKSLLEYSGIETCLVKLIISKSQAMFFEKTLLMWKINNYQLFPEIGSIALDVKKKYER